MRWRVVLQISGTTGGLAFAVPAKRGRLPLSRIKTSSKISGEPWISPMTVDALPPLPAAQLASLVGPALVMPSSKMPALHLAPMVLGYITTTADGPLVTADSLIRVRVIENA
jgi:hypothetical protein